jgi:hypothetical protein
MHTLRSLRICRKHSSLVRRQHHLLSKSNYSQGDHAQMFAHLAERVILKDRKGGSLDKAYNVALVNATNLQSVLQMANDADVCYS